MFKIYSKILATHTLLVVEQTSPQLANKIAVESIITTSSTLTNFWPAEVAIKIDFTTTEDSFYKGEGSFIAVTNDLDGIHPWLVALAEHHGLNEEFVAKASNARQLISEFINIVIGLAAAEWSIIGFDVNFDPPLRLSGQTSPLPNYASIAHTILSLPNGKQVDTLFFINN